MMVTESEKKTTIDLHAVDFDGCLFNKQYYQLFTNNVGLIQKRNQLRIQKKDNFIERSNNSLIEANDLFINQIIQNTKENPPNKLILINYSSRQDYKIDRFNAINYGSSSCFVALERLQKEFEDRLKGASFDQQNIPCELDRYLLSDTYNNKTAGTHFINGMKDSNIQNLWVFDYTKLTITYAQMHKIASENPNAKINYHCYDDGGQYDILRMLGTFFQSNPDLISHNVHLYLHHYAGGDTTEKYSIQGTGNIDKNYETSIKRMVERTTKHHCGDSLIDQMDVNVARHLRSSKLTAFKEERSFRFLISEINTLLKEISLSPELKNSIQDLEKILLSDVEESKSGEKIKTGDAMRVAKATKTLLDTLKIPNQNPQQILSAVETYQKNCSVPTAHLFAKAIAVVALTVLGFAVGAVAGAGIGILAGAWTGPGAAATGTAGLLMGAFKGASFGLALGTTFTGLSAGVISGYLFFKPPAIETAAKKVAEVAQQFASSSLKP